MAQQQPQKISPRQGARFDGAGVFGIPKRHLTVLAAQDVLFLQHPSIEVLPQVGQRLVATTNVLAVDHPVLRNGGADFQAFARHRLEPFRSEDLGEVTLMEQV